MNFSSSSLATLLLLCATNTNTSAFTVSSVLNTISFGPTAVLSSPRPGPSIFDKQETTDSKLDTNDDESSILVLSANHVFINGDIVERGLVKAMANLVLPLVFEHDDSHEHVTSTVPPTGTANSRDQTFKHSLSQIKWQ